MNVLQKVDENLFWELSGKTICCPVNIHRSSGTFTVYAYLTAYTCQEEITVRKGFFDGEGESAYWNFIDKHFIKFGGVQPDDPERHKMYLDQLLEIKKFIYEEAVQGVMNDVTRVESDSLEDEVIKVPTIHALYLPEEDKEVRFRSAHFLGMDRGYYTAYERCVENRSSKELLEIEMNFNDIDEIYNAAVLKAEGFLIGGSPCTKSNKKDWVEKIPFEYKFCSVDEAFRPARTE